jgi:CheY-like chemotaxis protein
MPLLGMGRFSSSVYKANQHMSKILVIDDDAVVRETIVFLLQDVGYEVLSAEDGVRGMALFRSEQPDLVITDLIMPEQEGLQTITEMLKDQPNAKIIAISGAARLGKMDFLKIAEVLGAMDAIRKPFEPAELLATVKNCLAGPAPGGNPGGMQRS